MRRTFSIALLFAFVLGTLLPSYALPMMKCCASPRSLPNLSSTSAQCHGNVRHDSANAGHEMSDMDMSGDHEMGAPGAAQVTETLATPSTGISANHVNGCPMPCCSQSFGKV